METGSIARILSAWEVVAVCIFLMLLLPTIFFIASRRRIPRRAPMRRPHLAARARPRPAAPSPAGGDDEEAGGGA